MLSLEIGDYGVSFFRSKPQSAVSSVVPNSLVMKSSFRDNVHMEPFDNDHIGEGEIF